MHCPARLRWLLLLAALPAAGCLLVQPLDTTSDPESGSSGGSTSHAGATGSAGKRSGSAGSSAAGSSAAGSSGSRASGGAPATGASLFIGTWTITDGSTTVVCNGQTSTQPVTGSDNWVAGTTSDLVLDPSTDCPLKADVSDHTATSQPGFSCASSGTNTSGDAYTSELTDATYTFVIASDGESATGSLTGTDTYTIAGSSVPCTFDEELDYTKD